MCRNSGATGRISKPMNKHGFRIRTPTGMIVENLRERLSRLGPLLRPLDGAVPSGQQVRSL